MTYRWLFLEGVELAVGQSERVAGVLVEMREGTIPLGDVEAKDAEANGTNELLLERALLLVSEHVCTLACQQVVLILVELFFHFATEHL